jgi:hypothetical protein
MTPGNSHPLAQNQRAFATPQHALQYVQQRLLTPSHPLAIALKPCSNPSSPRTHRQIYPNRPQKHVPAPRISTAFAR